ncbi:Uncharacterised protein [Enterobacter cloacae]|uniref:Uncharacterized protein n=1 Tax=Enterobacter cloacae TaxID=550 RepID=A0A377M0D4_ENTCL|nr:Uncharacterised protein [Enterobacter cloacae]
MSKLKTLALFTALALSANVFAESAPLTIQHPTRFDQLNQPSLDVQMPEPT